MDNDNEPEEGVDYGVFAGPPMPGRPIDARTLAEAVRNRDRKEREARAHAAWMRSLYRPDLTDF